MKHPFTYTVIFYNEAEGKDYRQEGVGLADSYVHAASQLEEFYGNCLTAVEEIKLYENSTLIPLSKSVVAGIRKELNDTMFPREEVKKRGTRSLSFLLLKSPTFNKNWNISILRLKAT